MNSKEWTVNQSLLVPQRKVSKMARKATVSHTCFTEGEIKSNHFGYCVYEYVQLYFFHVISVC